MYVAVFFFFKQKTAYDMRISDWSSDVCSSDLAATQFLVQGAEARPQCSDGFGLREPLQRGAGQALGRTFVLQQFRYQLFAGQHVGQARSEERRVGKEWVSTCRSRG